MQRVVDPPVQRALVVERRDVVEGERRRRAAARWERSEERRFAEPRAAAEPGEPPPGLRQHLRVHVDQLDGGSSGPREDRLREGAGPGAEVDDRLRAGGGDCAGGGLDHRAVSGDEAADRPVVGVDLDPQMAPHGVARYGVVRRDGRS